LQVPVVIRVERMIAARGPVMPYGGAPYPP
jgi:hypothetical protein